MLTPSLPPQTVIWLWYETCKTRVSLSQNQPVPYSNTLTAFKNNNMTMVWKHARQESLYLRISQFRVLTSSLPSQTIIWLWYETCKTRVSLSQNQPISCTDTLTAFTNNNMTMVWNMRDKSLSISESADFVYWHPHCLHCLRLHRVS